MPRGRTDGTVMDTVEIDTREKCTVLEAALWQEYGVHVLRRVLAIGDYRLPGPLCVERKTFDDFCVSILDGRLFRQAYRLAAAREDALIILEGHASGNCPSVQRTAICGALVSLAQTYRIPVLRTEDQCDTAWHFSRLCAQRRTLGKKSGPLRCTRRRCLRMQKNYVLRAISGVGPKTAAVLLDRFGSVHGLSAASVYDLKDVPGVGEKTAERIHEVLHEEMGVYCISSVSSA